MSGWLVHTGCTPKAKSVNSGSRSTADGLPQLRSRTGQAYQKVKNELSSKFCVVYPTNFCTFFLKKEDKTLLFYTYKLANKFLVNKCLSFVYFDF